MRAKPYIMILFLSALCGCSITGDSSSVHSASSSQMPSNEVSSPFSYTKKIELKQNQKASFSSYIKSTTGEDVTANPDTIDTSKEGDQTILVTLSDSKGNVALVEFEVTVKAEEKKEEPKTEEKKDEPETKQPEQTTPQQPASQPTQPVTPVQPQTPVQPTPTPTPQPTPAPSPQPSAPPEVEDVGPAAGTRGDPAGSTYDTQEGCNIGAGLASHTCTWDPLAKKYVLTY